MKKLVLILACATFATCAVAQKRVVDEVKSEIRDMNANSGTLRKSLEKIRPALKNDETKDDAQTWFLAGKCGFGLYDKCVGERAVGKPVDEKEMAKALIEGYEYLMQAYKLDSIPELEKDGTPKKDKKTGAIKFKSKHRKDIVSAIGGHVNDFTQAGNVLHDAKDFLGAAKCWGLYCDFEDAKFLGNARPEMVDTIVSQIRFYQGVAAWQGEDLQGAMAAFEKARKKGRLDKETFDYSMSVAASIPNNDEAVVAIAKEAYPIHGKTDNTYAKVIVNDLINKEKYDEANGVLDKVIAENPNNAECLDLKGVLLEQQGKTDDAIEYFNKAIAADGAYAKGYFDLGRMYFNKAIKTAEENEKLSGAKLAELTDPLYRQAMPALEKSYQLDPSNNDCKRALINIYYQLNEEAKLKAIEGN